MCAGVCVRSYASVFEGVYMCVCAPVDVLKFNVKFSKTFEQHWIENKKFSMYINLPLMSRTRFDSTLEIKELCCSPKLWIILQQPSIF